MLSPGKIAAAEHELLKARHALDTLRARRQHVWSLLSDRSLPQRERERLANEVQALTVQLNGHAADHRDGKKYFPSYTSGGGGLTESLRHLRVDLAVKSRTHEIFLDNIGRPLRRYKAA